MPVPWRWAVITPLKPNDGDLDLLGYVEPLGDYDRLEKLTDLSGWRS